MKPFFVGKLIKYALFVGLFSEIMHVSVDDLLVHVARSKLPL